MTLRDVKAALRSGPYAWPGAALIHRATPWPILTGRRIGRRRSALLAIVRDMLAYEAKQFDGAPDTDLNVSGADLVDAFSAWREQLRRAIEQDGVA